MNKQESRKELVKLADLMEACDYQGANYKEYLREYKRIAKLLYPEIYYKNQNSKPCKDLKKEK